MHGRLAAPERDLSESEDLSAGLPTVGPAVEIRPHRRVLLDGKAAGLKAGGYGYFVRSESGIKLFWSHLLFTAG